MEVLEVFQMSFDSAGVQYLMQCSAKLTAVFCKAFTPLFVKNPALMCACISYSEKLCPVIVCLYYVIYSSFLCYGLNKSEI